jgi:hypothetical protein
MVMGIPRIPFPGKHPVILRHAALYALFRMKPPRADDCHSEGGAALHHANTVVSGAD